MGGPPILQFLKVFYYFGLTFIVFGLFLVIFMLFWILEGVVFDDFDWDPILGSKTKNVLRV